MIESLLPSEIILLRFLATGYSDTQIANRLLVTTKEVKDKLQTIYKKLNVDNRIQAAHKAAIFLHKDGFVKF